MPSLKFHKFFKLQKYLYSSRKKKEKQATGEFFFLFLKLVRINYIFPNNVCIMSIDAQKTTHYFLKVGIF
jgi:hypothetical protein